MSNFSVDWNQKEENEGEEDDKNNKEIYLTSLQERTKTKPKLLDSTAARSSCSIFRVPQHIKKLHPKFFEPETVSIGPYYHGRKHLDVIQEHKWRILGIALDRLQDFNVGIQDIFEAIEIKEEEIRGCYSESTDKFNSREWIEMMILDGCFIIELLCTVEHVINPYPDDPLFHMPCMLFSLTRDLLRLENQIPFFVLQILYKLLIPDAIRNATLQELILGLCNYSLPRSVDVNLLRERYKNNDGEHFLDFYRSTFIPDHSEEESSIQIPSSKENSNVFRLIQPVEKLREAGIKFKEREGTDSFLDIKFSENGVLEIPRLVTDDLITCFLLNCIAFEQCYKHRSLHFTSYAVFMGCLINTSLDSGYLRDRRIIENFFGTDKEVVNFFNEVGRDIFFDIEETYLGKVFEDVNKYYRNDWHVRWAGFKYNYFGSPWIFISAAAASVVLILTFVQAFFAVFSYFKPPL